MPRPCPDRPATRSKCRHDDRDAKAGRGQVATEAAARVGVDHLAPTPHSAGRRDRIARRHQRVLPIQRPGHASRLHSARVRPLRRHQRTILSATAGPVLQPVQRLGPVPAPVPRIHPMPDRHVHRRTTGRPRAGVRNISIPLDTRKQPGTLDRHETGHHRRHAHRDCARILRCLLMVVRPVGIDHGPHGRRPSLRSRGRGIRSAHPVRVHARRNARRRNPTDCAGHGRHRRDLARRDLADGHLPPPLDPETSHRTRRHNPADQHQLDPQLLAGRPHRASPEPIPTRRGCSAGAAGRRELRQLLHRLAQPTRLHQLGYLPTRQPVLALPSNRSRRPTRSSPSSSPAQRSGSCAAAPPSAAIDLRGPTTDAARRLRTT